jgi:hypothetical protein
MIAGLASAALLACTPPAAASNEFYLAQDASTGKCRIIDRPPATTASTLLSNGRVYHVRDDAEQALRSLDLCSSANTDSAANTPRRAR